MSATDPAIPTRARILFVDDEPSIRLTLSAILQQHGFQVTVASTVAEALALITAEHYDVLLSDLNIGHAGGRLYGGKRYAPRAAARTHAYPYWLSGI
jgi:PleD family two-component response regulator